MGNFAELSRIVVLNDSGTWGDESDSDCGVPVLRSTNIQDGQLVLVDVARRKLSEKHLVSKRLETGDIIVTTSSGSPELIGKCCYFEQPPDGTAYYFSNFTLRLRPNPEQLAPKYLFYWLKSEPARVYLRRMSDTTSGLRNLNRTLYLSQKVPLPSVHEQRTIVRFLESCDSLIDKRKQAIVLLDTLTRAIFADMFGNVVTNERGWDVLLFSEVCESRLGKMLDQRRQAHLPQRPYLRNLNVQWNNLDLGDVQFMGISDDESEKYRLTYGDLLICEGGEVGRAAIWHDQLPDCYFQKALHRTRPRPTLATPEYMLFLLWFYAENGGFKDFVSSATIAHLTGEKLARISVPVPPIALQNEFTQKLNQVKQLKAKLTDSLEELKQLYSSFQDEFFWTPVVRDTSELAHV